MSLLLASGSPQRSSILDQLGIPFRVWVPDLRELTTGDPSSLALRNSRLKAEAARGQAAPDEIVVAVDTIVVLDGVVHGKPSCEQAADDMLSLMRGRTHTVISGLTLCFDGTAHGMCAETSVSFRDFDVPQLRSYLDTGEWEGRAGGYAIQGSGAALVAAINGDYLNVVGFPVAAFLDLIDELGVRDRVYSDSVLA